jgi:hypothetical protein
MLEKFTIEGNQVKDINRSKMAEILAELNFNVGAEIGVAEGLHAEVLCKANSKLLLHCIDAWTHYPGYEEYEDLDHVEVVARTRLSKYSTHLIKSMSSEAVKRFPDNSLDFVYIDAGHDFLNVATDIALWTPKVRSGGIVFGHDYKHRAHQEGRRFPVHVKDVVEAYVSAYEIPDFYVLTNDIKDPTFGPDNKGWMFVKP